MKFTNLKIGARLGTGFALLLALMTIMTVVGVWRLQAVGETTDVMVEASKNQQSAQEWLRGIEINALRTLAYTKTTDADELKLLDSQIGAQSGQIGELQKKMEVVMKSEAGKKLFAEVGVKRAAYRAARDGTFKLKEAGQDPSGESLKQMTGSKLLPAMDAYVKSVNDVLDHQTEVFEQAHMSIDSTYESSRNLLVGLGIAALALGAVLAWLLSRSITKPLNEAVAIARTVAAGDLTSAIEVKANDETGQLIRALKDMNDSLFRTVAQVRHGTDTIATASQQIAAGNHDLSSRTEQQASSLEETASSMEELTSTVKQNADNARQANHLAASASDIATKGGAVVARVVETMGSINESSRKIVDIISVIDSIAFQTNILALNAAVEAARAGEQGRGFAVVATEVRNLAQRSAAAAQEIKTLIDDSVGKVDAGSKLVGEAGSTMDEIVNSVKLVTDIMSEIMAATQEQSAGIEQVNQAIGQMDQVTQQNAALVEEASAAAESMQEQATSLTQVVSVFKIYGNSQPSIATTAPRPVHGIVQKVAPKVTHERKARTNIAAPSSRREPVATSAGDWEEF